jgi:hypothetical protein
MPNALSLMGFVDFVAVGVAVALGFAILNGVLSLIGRGVNRA